MPQADLDDLRDRLLRSRLFDSDLGRSPVPTGYLRELVTGYALFGLPKRSAHIRLAHLCVAEEQRGRRIGRRLVEGIKERYPQRLGIKAKCRRDYELSGMWRSLGFVPHGEVQGRGRGGEILDGWWLDLGHPDRFTDMR